MPEIGDLTLMKHTNTVRKSALFGLMPKQHWELSRQRSVSQPVHQCYNGEPNESTHFTHQGHKNKLQLVYSNDPAAAQEMWCLLALNGVFVDLR